MKVVEDNEDDPSDQDDEDDGELFKARSTSSRKKYDAMNCDDHNRFKGDEKLSAIILNELKALNEMKEREQAGATDSGDGGHDDESEASIDNEDFDENSVSDENSEEYGDADEEEDDAGIMGGGEDFAPFMKALKERFVTGSWGKASEDADGEFGEFEDMQTGEVFDASKTDGDAEDDDDDANEAANEQIDEQLRQANAMKKASAKAAFDASYDASKSGSEKIRPEEAEEEKVVEIVKRKQEEQRMRNLAEFGEDGELIRLQHEGVRQGVYVRIIIRGVPVEFIANFDPKVPIVLGGLLAQETSMGLIRCRVKRHRWHKRVLKSNDPLIFSVGWRRYQSIPVYSMEDVNRRERYLKYTPEHMHCNCTFYGPLIPPNTGILAFQKASRNLAGFRICLTGTALELQVTPVIVKKLKLVGTPHKIYKNTAFINGMFNSALEVAKFEGAKIKTVSGIRGQIKKAIQEGGGGMFRASFEDKILMSDIVICRTWVPVDVRRFYNPVMSLLTSSAGDGANKAESWQGLR